LVEQGDALEIGDPRVNSGDMQCIPPCLRMHAWRATASVTWKRMLPDHPSTAVTHLLIHL